MATEAELRLGRLAVESRVVTEEQVLAALRERNKVPDGDLGEQLVKLGLLARPKLDELRARVAKGEGTTKKTSQSRADQSTDSEISLAGPREAIARDQLEQALAELKRDRASALRELDRLAREFADTESGVRAGLEARRLRG